jgi:hypothetical protein
MRTNLCNGLPGKAIAKGNTRGSRGGVMSPVVEYELDQASYFLLGRGIDFYPKFWISLKSLFFSSEVSDFTIMEPEFCIHGLGWRLPLFLSLIILKIT